MQGIPRLPIHAILLAVVGALAGSSSAGSPASETRRNRMIEDQLIARGIRNERVLDAMRKVPREGFVPENLRPRAYEDGPLPIGYGQTISQPYIVAFMTEKLDPQPGERVLEIGTGSGYQAAVLSKLVGKVFTIEIVEPLAKTAAAALADGGYGNVEVRAGDGYRGWPEKAPFDAIVVTAAPERVPEPLVEQLKEGGRMAIPVGGEREVQSLKIFVKRDGELHLESDLPVRFVPMTGEVRE